MTRAFDKITEDTPGQTLVITRDHPEVRWASMREFFSSFALDAPRWSALRFEGSPARIILFSAPSAKKRAELLITDQHQLTWSFGEELGGPIPVSLQVGLSGSICLSINLRLKELRRRESCKDLVFRSANILGFGAYQLEHEDAQHLRVSLSRREDTSQLAYREESRVSLPVAVIRTRANYQRASLSHHGTPLRATDDSYLVFSWEPQRLIHFVASNEIDWDTPRSEWRMRALREVKIDFPKRTFYLQEDYSKQDIPFSLFRYIHLSRALVNGACRVSLSIFYSGIVEFRAGRFLLAESSLCESHGEALESLSLLAISLAEVLKIPCYADLFAVSSGASLRCLAPLPSGLLFAGGDLTSAIAYLPDGSNRYSLHTKRQGSFIDVSLGESTQLALSTGDIHEHQDGRWIEHRPLGKASLYAIAQDNHGITLAVGGLGRAFVRRRGALWEGIPKEQMPWELQDEPLIGAVFCDVGFLVAGRSGALFRVMISPDSSSWMQVRPAGEPIDKLLVSGSQCWIALESGKLLAVKTYRDGIVCNQALLPNNHEKIIAVFRGEGREVIAVGDAGSLWSLISTSAASLRPKRIEVAYAILERQMSEMNPSGLWSELALGWASVDMLPSHAWSAATHQDGFLYLISGDILVRLSGRF